jgi:thiamine-phosphate pyrophosphorylase
MKPLADCRLYAFVDTAYFHGRAPEVFAQQLCDGGADLIQLRAKKSTPDEVRRMAEAMLPVTRRANVGLIINDHPDIARETGAEFCHLGQEDFFDAGYKNISQLSALNSPTSAGSSGATAPKQSEGRQLKIGLSTHTPEQAQRALAAGPDYIAIGPVYSTRTKPMAKPVTLEYVRWAAANVKIPWFAIGGINLQRLNEVLAAGATRICVVSAILNATDVTKACSQFRHRLG